MVEVEPAGARQGGARDRDDARQPDVAATHSAGPAGSGAARVEIWAVPGIGVIHAGDDIATVVVEALAAASTSAEGPGPALQAGDVVAIASKIVAKAESRLFPATERARLLQEATVRVVAQRRSSAAGGITSVVESAAGPVMAAAGLDGSNLAADTSPSPLTEPGGEADGQVLALPVDADASAERIRAAIVAAVGVPIGVVITDTASRPWRLGVTDFALGAAGLAVVEDLRGELDDGGRRMDVTIRGVADEIAAAADLAKGKLGGHPAAIVRGLGRLVRTEADATEPDDHGASSPTAATPAAARTPTAARALVRTGRTDWFQFGHVEAVRAALGWDPNGDGPALEPPHIDPDHDDVDRRAARAITLALHSARWDFSAWSVQFEGGTFVVALAPGDGETSAAAPTSTPDPVALGALLARLEVAAWSEDVEFRVTLPDRGTPGSHTPS